MDKYTDQRQGDLSMSGDVESVRVQLTARFTATALARMRTVDT